MKNFMRTTIALVALIVGHMPLAGADQPDLISDCGAVLSEPGNYALKMDLILCPEQAVFFGAITITSSDVTLDLRDHTITCDPTDGFINPGISVFPGLSNVSIKNGTISNCDIGIATLSDLSTADSGITNSEIKDMNLIANLPDPAFGFGMGLYLESATENRIVNNNISGNRIGLFNLDSSSNRISENEVSGNLASGIYIFTSDFASNDNQIVCNTASSNGNGGIVVLGNSTGNKISGNVATGNGIVGIGAISATYLPFPPPNGNQISENTAAANGVSDLAEAIFDPGTFSYLPTDNEPCRNSWSENEFATETGPQMCIGSPAEQQLPCGGDAGID